MLLPDPPAQAPEPDDQDPPTYHQSTYSAFP
jgi:hypothetical protein